MSSRRSPRTRRYVRSCAPARVVAPQAELKIYLAADPGERARRRRAARPAAPAPALVARDAGDAERMQPAADAVYLDTTGLSIAEVVERIEALLRERAA